ncbi:NADH:flavin oxidoreductase/NADH oxidase [Nitrosomonas sp. HPC101]|uniref:NADH:flavin oxidoreductase/NADH oxidase n=1 Tax=Nitrosomonas sp. HPC101 TaxID=1658667 RepID=UPI00136E32D6|nr:NADH:flavin oxidoreductase/NADH oxidase [Nitrosomonas sp. HPC101]MXS86270.1 NADH:flavin oxidoreductase/NADH oxidase [Nitrosomonas sp. HPC101]
MNEPRSTDDQTSHTVNHGCPAGTEHDREVPEIDLLSPLTLRGITLRNRIVMSPMCQYVAEEGVANDWHLVHLGSRAVGGVALVVVEATAVSRDGRIAPGDLGIWGEQHVEPLARITRFIRSQGAIAGIQLAHAGRKASCESPWIGGASLKTPEKGGWPVIGPSPIPFNEGDPVPIALDEAGINEIVSNFEAAARRALAAGFQMIEIHAAHGYLLHEFLSPLSNHRTDRYGGSLENRMRLLLRVARCLRQLLPQDLPLFVRISATDWADGGWDIEQSVVLCQHLKDIGVDLIDVSSGALVPKARVPVSKGYQVPFARRIRDDADIMTGAVGLITEPRHADEIITGGDADLVFIGRELLREPYWALKAEHELGTEPSWPTPYGYAVSRRAK